MSFDDCRVKSELSKTKVSDEALEDVLFVLFTINGLEFMEPRSVTSATLLKSFTTSEKKLGSSYVFSCAVTEK